MPRLDPASLLADLDPEQREAVLATQGPVAILAGAGSGKTRVISRRAAYAIATEAVRVDQALIVTFTDKAAGEMVSRLRDLGLPGVTARTFHAQALSQLRHFWPDRHDGEPLPELLDSKLPIIGRLARQLPGHYRFTPAKDLADEIEWAKSRRIPPRAYEDAADESGREPPIPADLFVRVYDGYERAKVRAGRIDFDDLLLETIALLERDQAAADLVRARKSWFSVDEYQDTSPLQQRLLELWLGDGRDLCVVGDEDQTIYTFTGATSGFLTSFAQRWPGAREVTLVRNYRSSPQVLALANRLLAGEGRAKRLIATRPDRAEPVIARHATAQAELDALVAWIGVRVRAGTRPAEIAVLVRVNAQLVPIEAALTRAGIAYQVRGVPFYQRSEVRGALAVVRRMAGSTGRSARIRGAELAAEIEARWRRELGLEDEAAATGERGDEARERQASLDTLLAIVEALLADDPAADATNVLAELEARAAAERDGSADGVNLLTYHRAKGLEWDAVALPSLEEGLLPIRQAGEDPAALAEERRLLYVGITRAREHLLLSWAETRVGRGGSEGRRRPSRFLASVRPPVLAAARGGRPSRSGAAASATGPLRAAGTGDAARASAAGDPLFEALRAWRLEKARELGQPPYVIAHDATLAALAEARPGSIEALWRVKGIGPSKADRFGVEILEVVARVAADE
ncbi:MAG TPA: ATP-dependent DNA helicase UvrD2 [Candidatus Limnocylindrales bacterium]